MVSREIFNDWKGAFPFLTEFSKSTLYLRVGIVMLGLRLESSQYESDDYQVYLECRSLWDDSDGYNRFDIFNYRLEGKIGNTFYLSSKKEHDFYFSRAEQRAREQFGDVLQEKIRLSSIMNLFTSPDKDIDNPNFWKPVYEFVFALSTYLDDINLRERLMREIEWKSKRWKYKWVRTEFDMEFEEWMNGMYERVGNREKLMAQVEKNLESWRVRNLNEAQLIIDDFLFPSEKYRNTSQKFKDFFANAMKRLLPTRHQP